MKLCDVKESIDNYFENIDPYYLYSISLKELNKEKDMKNLILKTDSVKFKLKPSITKNTDIDSISLVVKTERPLIPLYKFIGIKPFEESF